MWSFNHVGSAKQTILVQVIEEVDTDDKNISAVAAEKDKMRVWGTMFCRSARMCHCTCSS
jgi:hypothetical protein